MKSKRPVFLNLLLITSFMLFSCTERTKNDKTTEEQSTGLSKDTVATTVLEVTDKQPANVEEIKKSYLATQAKAESGALDSVFFKYSCRGEKNGTVSYFTEKGKLRMIVHRYHEYDHYSAVDRYFVKDSTLFFVYRKGTSWSFESGPDGTTRDNVTEQRVYLVDQQPVRCLEKKYATLSNALDNPQPETVPNKVLDCSSLKSGLQMYRTLAKYRNKAPVDCIEN